MKRPISRSLLKRGAALLCAVSLVVPSAHAAAGKEILQTKTEVVNGLTYYNSVTENTSGRVESFLLELESDSGIRPMLVTGDGTVYGGTTISTAVKNAQEQGLHVLAAINTDFFASSSGIPLGIVIQDGEYQSSSSTNAAIVINEDGEFSLCEEPEVSLTLTNKRIDEEIIPDHFNKLRTASGGLYLLNDDFSTVSTRADGSGWYVLMKKVNEEDQLTVDTTMKLEVIEMFRYDQPIAIREGEYILTADDRDNLGHIYDCFEIGDIITLTTECENRTLRKAQWASGCGDVLVNKKKVTDSKDWDSSLTSRAPRTAFGLKSDGTAFLYVVDGRRTGYSAGLSYQDLAEELKDLGCKWAVNLDGGGSSAMSVWVPGLAEPTVQNRPSDGYQRKCSSYLLLTTKRSGDGDPDRLALAQDGMVVLKGSSFALPDTVVIDRGLEVLETLDTAEDVRFSAKLGDVDDGIYTAANKSGTDTLKLRADGVSGTATIHVVDELTELNVKCNGESVTALTLSPSETLSFTVTGSYWGRTALRDMDNVKWDIEGDIGEMAAQGVFTAADTAAEGSLTVSAGGLKQVIPVRIESDDIEVPAEHWAYAAVKYANSKGMLDGVPTENFDWDGNITRAQFVLALHNVLGKPEASSPCDFTDVAPDDYYYAALSWGQALGIAGGMGDGTFLPDGQLNREQAFTLLRRALPQLDITCLDASLSILTQYEDADKIADWAKGHIATLTVQGLVNGTGGGVSPQGDLTWAQTAALLYRLSSFSPVSADTQTAEKVALCIAEGNLNIRLAPDANAEILEKLPGGSLVMVTGEAEGWYQVLLVNSENLLVSGYGSAAYLELQ